MDNIKEGDIVRHKTKQEYAELPEWMEGGRKGYVRNLGYKRYRVVKIRKSGANCSRNGVSCRCEIVSLGVDMETGVKTALGTYKCRLKKVNNWIKL